ncbi:hypothetical protein COCSADRAFT_103874 [Bipolaris sorokiniana ND90Pr]|uniref:Methyltransferase n=1 Tax=Cochliobolus sativus (strain ND90Pr / ATCC 201652) TaxID=665912 RepID=M2SMN2_COCSN|nr:uncharacterized protein COCSADRAFT_103874 [Bipolaris sorokiniana ND90Pr]EMD58401.1 hypothetical protein COCSADRAFT_103874 [Bipolaris sorokiniana ND90Pr]
MSALPKYDTEMLYIEPWQDKIEAPYYRTNPDPGFEVKNYDWIPYKVSVEDCRSAKESFTLNDHAFAFVDDSDGGRQELLQAIRDINTEKIEKEYYPAVEALVKRKTGADKVIIFNHSIRKRDPKEGFFGSPGKQQPGRTARHKTPKGAIRRARQYAGEEAEELLKGRFRIINVWRPINGPVQDWPLATMDGKSLREENLHATDLWKNQWEELGSTYNISHGSGQKWYYLGGQRPDEALLIKIYDNSPDVPAKLCPHCAFEHPETKPDAPRRESIEVRCLVFGGH